MGRLVEARTFEVMWEKKIRRSYLLIVKKAGAPTTAKSSSTAGQSCALISMRAGTSLVTEASCKHQNILKVIYVFEVSKRPSA
jgi:hypothetical protein